MLDPTLQLESPFQIQPWRLSNLVERAVNGLFSKTSHLHFRELSIGFLNLTTGAGRGSDPCNQGKTLFPQKITPPLFPFFIPFSSS